jgi:chromosome segregation ATPase
MVLQVAAQGVKQLPAPEKTPTLLAQLSGIVTWFNSIMPKLAAIGSNADRDKLKDSLRAISGQLGKTEETNRDVVDNLKSEHPDYPLLRRQLSSVQRSLESIAGAITEIRSALHLQGQTSIERHASDAVHGKEDLVAVMLDELQYEVPRDPNQVSALKAQSDQLLDLLHKAQDAVEEAEKAVASSDKKEQSSSSRPAAAASPL